MTKSQRRTAKWAIAALAAVAAILGSVMFNSLAPVPGEAQPSGPDSAYLKYEIANKTGADVCGLNVLFEGLEVPANQALAEVRPFTRLTPTDQHNRVSLGGACLRPDERAVLTFAPGVGMGATLFSYAWIKTGDGLSDLLIPGSFDGVFKELVQPSRPMAVFAPQEENRIELPLTTFTFELRAMPHGRLLVTQDMVVYEGQPVGVIDQVRQQELTQKLQAMNTNAVAGLFGDRQKVQRELDALTIYSPFSGQVKALSVDTDGQTARVTLQLASLDALDELTVQTLD